MYNTNGQREKKRRKKNLNVNEYSLYFSSAIVFLYSEQNRSTHIESDKKKKKKANIRLHTTHTITEMMYCTEGEKPELCVCVQREEKKKEEEKNVAEKEKNLAQTD